MLALTKITGLILKVMLSLNDLKFAIGLGVAGNFTGHLEQAGEARDFTNVQVAELNSPKGIFPFYVPSQIGSFLEVFPLSSDAIAIANEDANLQIEPEVALICKLTYEANKVRAIKPEYFAAYNDCSIRRPGAHKISHKKNWGRNSKGLSSKFIQIDKFTKGGVMDNYHIASYLKRDGKFYTYGIDSPVLGYSYFYEKLLNWIIEKVNNQQDEGPLESIATLLEQSKYPEYAVISIGATKYTELGETTFLKKGDEIYVVIYDSKAYKSEFLKELLLDEELYIQGKYISVLKQTVI
jgi:hypothetical protein